VTTYNWANLSDHDFEGVCRDAMAKSLGVQVEAFATGPDGGIDLRATVEGRSVIGQAKHYMRSPYSSLLTAVKKERTKLASMTARPSRYILYTSQPLTPARKTELKKALSPYVRRLADIVGLEELEGFLVQNPEIEESHYKLWLASARVLERIMGSATLTRSEIRIEEILDRARVYVPHSRFQEATDILRSEHCLIISGPPGIGKTTMAEMLTLKFLEAEYRAYFVASVDELEERIKANEKQVFVYDDFLGRTNFREAPGAASQERLFTMMRYIARRPNKYFILTTREYLYREAYAANERLAESRADLMRCVLDVDGYSQTNRARILYNHLYWTAGIPREALVQFVTDGGHWKVIGHENFNPRWIADTLNRLAEPTAVEETSPPWT
jgi:hypothetical protein